ncbi:MAG: extracellular solute-binding protein, partial [Methylococcales bacterium]|nr:extracellular solute-binding protein [Methylococcales bacterium]
MMNKMFSKNAALSALLVLMAAFLLVACGSAEPEIKEVQVTTIVEKEVEKEVEVTVVVEKEVEVETEVEVTVVVEKEVEVMSGEPIVLEFYHWFGADLGETTIKEINDRFHEANPNITVEFETADTETFSQVLNTRLSADDAPDLFGVFPGTKFHPKAEA